MGLCFGSPAPEPALCLYLAETLEKDREKNKKVNSIVIWIIPVLSNITFWISYAIMVRHMDLPIMRIMAWLFAVMYLVLGNYMPKCRPNNVVGIRVKWTASSEENWNATHRLAGPCYMICGFLMIPVSFLPEKERKDVVKKTCQRTFQALRIDVNNEFEVLYEFMEKLPGALKPGGRAAILTFHSGEDKLVKKALKQGYKDGIYSDFSKDVIRPSAEECARNGRARSTKMRWAVKA